MTPSLGSINLPKGVPELRKPVYLIDRPFIIKGSNLGTARWRRCMGQGVAKTISRNTSLPEIFRYPSTQKFSKPHSLLGFMETIASI